MSRQEVLTNCGSVGTGRRARLRILWAMRSCGFKSHLPHLTLGKPCKSQIYRAFLYFNFTMYSFFTRKSVLKFSERLTSIRKEYFHENCHVRSEIQASQTCAYLNWVILGSNFFKYSSFLFAFAISLYSFSDTITTFSFWAVTQQASHRLLLYCTIP